MNSVGCSKKKIIRNVWNIVNPRVVSLGNKFYDMLNDITKCDLGNVISFIMELVIREYVS